MKTNRIFHVISNTHWDREWRYPFQENRQMLVEMMDTLLYILENEPNYRAFHLDSQTILLEDYLQVRPQNRDLIKKFVQEKRLLIGPWFILPDEFQVGGESLIRNLLSGHRIGAEFGHVMKVGYSPFSWGQISQLPQIYQGFGIDVVMFYRGINSLDSPKAEFIWEGADGTRVLTSRFSTMPRYNFYFYIYRPVIHNEQIAEIEYRWTKGGQLFHDANPQIKENDYFLLQPADTYHRENLKPAIEAIIRDQADDFTTPHIFWAEGHDSSGPHVRTVQIIKDANQFLPDDKVVHSTLEDYALGLKNTVDRDKLKLVQGERRSSQYDRRSGNLYGYTTSARMYLKQTNFESEKWLQFYAEPFNVIANLLGLTTNDRYLDIAWHLLLQNSAHDSIGGCSLDEAHEDMVNRYKQCQEIAKGVFQRACKHLFKGIDLTNYPNDSIHLVAVNPNTFERSDIVEAFIDIPEELDRGNIAISDARGKEVKLQLIRSFPVAPVLEQMIDRPLYLKIKRYYCYLHLLQIPALGFKTVHIYPTSDDSQPAELLGRMEAESHIIENQFLQITINKNGTLNILDKRAGQRFSDLGYFYDEGEAGHAWVHQPIDPIVTTEESSPEIQFSTNGSLICICQIVHEIELPETIEDRKDHGKTAILPIELNVILRKDSKRVEFLIKVNNTAESHRLRIMFPTDIPAQYSYGEGQFDVVARSLDRPDTSDWIEQPMVDFPLHHFVDISDGNHGAAILVSGLKEYEVLDDDRKTIAITLFRAFPHTIQPSSLQDYSFQKGSQCLGKGIYRLAFYPHSRDWSHDNVYQEALSFNNELRLFQMGRTTGTLSEETSFCQIEPAEIIFSCLKQPEDKQNKSFVLRAYNPTDHNLIAIVKFLFPLNAVHQLTLEEKFIKQIPISDTHQLKVSIDKKKIITLRIMVD